jgi:hypothetical protein
MTHDAINLVNVWLAIVGIALSGAIMAILLLGLRSFGAYTEHIKDAHARTRQSNEAVRQEIARWTEHNAETVAQNEAILKALHRMREDLINQRSA